MWVMGQKEDRHEILYGICALSLICNQDEKAADLKQPTMVYTKYLTLPIGAGNARQQGAHMLPGLPRAGTIRGLNTISPTLLCPGKVTSISQDRAQHLIGGRIIRV
jgi:hypothetical protein